MHLALTLNPFVDTDLLYAQQLGIDWIVGDVPAWDSDTLAAACNRVKQSGMILASLACLPTPLMTSVLSGRPEGEEALAAVCRIISDAGRLGIPCLRYRWPVADSGGAAGITTGRGGAASSVYRIDTGMQDSRHPTRTAMWRSLSDFLGRVVPVAEAAGVRLAYQTDIALILLPEEQRILDSVAELDRLFQVAGSPNHGVDLDHGFVTQVLCPQAGLGTDEAIRHLGRDERVFAVRIRALRSTDGGAEEIFLDEDKVAVLRALQAYRDLGFEGALCPIPSPDMTDDTALRHKGIAFDIGYLRALLQAIG